jgi:hypothetical protein
MTTSLSLINSKFAIPGNFEHTLAPLKKRLRSHGATPSMELLRHCEPMKGFFASASHSDATHNSSTGKQMFAL